MCRWRRISLQETRRFAVSYSSFPFFRSSREVSLGIVEISNFLFSDSEKGKIGGISMMHVTRRFIHPSFSKMSSDLPASLVGGRVRPCRLFTDSFSSPTVSLGTASEAGSETIPNAPLKQCDSFVVDDGPRSKIRDKDLRIMRRKYGIHSSVRMRSPSEFERAPDGGPGEIAIYEAYLAAGFRGIVPPLVAEVSSFFGLCPSQLTPLSWKILMSIQVLGELHGLDVGIHEVLYSYRFVPLRVTPGLYYLRPRDNTPLVEEPRKGVWNNSAFENNWSGRYVFMKIQEPVHYPTFWRIVGNAARLPVTVLYDEYQQAEAQKKRPFYAPPPRLAKTASSGMGVRSFCSESVIGDAPLAGIQQRLLTELFSLRNRVKDIAAQRDLLIQQVRASTRWELMKEWTEKRTEHWNPLEEYRQHLFWSAGLTSSADGSSAAGPSF